MSGDPATSSPATSRPFAAILTGGLVVGVLDLIYAIVVYSPNNPFSSRKRLPVAFSVRNHTMTAREVPRWEWPCTSLSL